MAGEAQRGGLAQGLDREDRLLVPARRMGRELGGGEVARRVLDRALVVGELEVHRTRLRYCMVGMTKLESASPPSGQRAVTVLTLV